MVLCVHFLNLHDLLKLSGPVPNLFISGLITCFAVGVNSPVSSEV